MATLYSGRCQTTGTTIQPVPGRQLGGNIAKHRWREPSTLRRDAGHADSRVTHVRIVPVLSFRPSLCQNKRSGGWFGEESCWLRQREPIGNSELWPQSGDTAALLRRAKLIEPPTVSRRPGVLAGNSRQDPDDFNSFVCGRQRQQPRHSSIDTGLQQQSPSPCRPSRTRPAEDRSPP